MTTRSAKKAKIVNDLIDDNFDQTHSMEISEGIYVRVNVPEGEDIFSGDSESESEDSDKEDAEASSAMKRGSRSVSVEMPDRTKDKNHAITVQQNNNRLSGISKEEFKELLLANREIVNEVLNSRN